jgi:cell division protein FtsW
MDQEIAVGKRHVLANLFKGDKVIWMIFFFLCAISLIEVYSAASTLTYKSGNFWTPIVQHALFLFIGTIVVIGIHNIPCRFFKFYPIFILFISTFLLLAVLVGVGVMRNGAARWLSIFGIPFQPSELAKGGVVIGVALILSAMQTEKGADRHAFRYIMVLTLFFCGLILPENFSTAALLFLVVFFMMFIGRIPLIQLGKLLGVLAILTICTISLVMITPKETLTKIPKLHRLTTWKSRMAQFSGDHTKRLSPKDFDIDKNAQIAHAHIAIATSNIIGKFPGNSVERDFLSQAFSDFIYAIIIEEMGLIGGAFVILLYLILLFRASRIANRCERNFPAFLVLGLSLLLVTQAVVNMCVAVGILPVTGQPLPLISKGGTSTLINCAYIGMILSVSRFAKKREPDAVPSSSNEIESAFTDDRGIE